MLTFWRVTLSMMVVESKRRTVPVESLPVNSFSARARGPPPSPSHLSYGPSTPSALL
jgi:hypothetical protein